MTRFTQTSRPMKAKMPTTTATSAVLETELREVIDAERLGALATRYVCHYIILPEDRADEADGFAHMFHICPKKPSYHRPRPLTRREKFKAQYD